MRIRLSFLAVLLAFAIPATAQNPQDHSAPDRAADVQTAFARAQHLKHGINASGWFGGTGDTSAEHIASFTDDGAIAEWAGLRRRQCRIHRKLVQSVLARLDECQVRPRCKR